MPSPRPPRSTRSLGASRSPRLAPRATAFAAALLLACAAHAQSGPSPRLRVDIAPAPLDRAISALAQQTGVQVFLSSELAQGRAAPALSGDFTAREALERLVSGSGLVVRVQDEKTFTIERTPAVQGSTMAEVQVVAEADVSGTTEGTGSYTTPSASTATKLSLSLRETPQSATVITRQRMDDEAMTSIVDVVRGTPGLFLSGSDGVGRPNITARGFNANVMYEGFTSAWSSFLPSSQANMALFDRVEVVRGATGLAQGAGNPSAAINMVHKRPTRDFQGSVTASTGSWDDYGLSADVGGPLNAAGTLRGRLVAAGQDARTFRDAERHDHGLLYGVLEADLGARTLLTVGAHRQTDFTNHFWYDLPISGTGQHLNAPRSTFAGNDWEFSKNRVTTAFATLEHGFGDEGKLRLATLQSWRDLDLLGTATYRDSANATSNTFYQSVWGGKYAYRHENYDVSASSPFDLFGRKHQAVVGATHQSMDATTHNRNWAPSRINNVDIFTHNPYAAPQPVGTFTTTTSNVTTQDSAYAASHLHLTDRWKLLMGGRVDWYEYANRSGAGSYKVNRNATRYAGLTYDLNDTHTLYTSYTDIFNPQTAKGIDGNILKPIVGENYEAGIKGEYFGGALNASLAVFQIDQTNRARTLDDQSACPTFPESSCSEAAGLVRTRGLDIEVQGALTPRWQVGAGYTYADTRYVRDTNPNNVGRRFTTNTNPQNMLKLSTLYRFAGDWQRWRAGASLYWQSRIYSEGTTAGLAWRNQQAAYAVTDLLIGYKPTPKVDIQLNVTNLFDRVYYRAVGYSTQWGTDIYGEPRKVKLTARYTF
ncbi:MAG: TonB-dependent siderophore receptor [Acidovorax sp.]|uniref:TonB-dependent siderophore receptor n=1 Tax=Acidovorax sp. TaxID=1872122 RepID=UPI00391D14A7